MVRQFVSDPEIALLLREPKRERLYLNELTSQDSPGQEGCFSPKKKWNITFFRVANGFVVFAAHRCLYLSVTVFPFCLKDGSVLKGLQAPLVVRKASQVFPSSCLP